MTTSGVLAKEKIISLSELQKNPARALDGAIIRIVKNGKEIGIYLSKKEFEDMMEEHLPLSEKTKQILETSKINAKKKKFMPLHTLLKP